jgi:hypothetical protein
LLSLLMLGCLTDGENWLKKGKFDLEDELSCQFGDQIGNCQIT